MNSISRARFLRGDWREPSPCLRPPWALAEALFTASCDGCSLCVGVCPQNILRLNRGFPEVDFSRGECTFCGECRAVCVPGALQLPTASTGEGESDPWSNRAVISVNCLALNGISCIRCAETCALEAFVTRPAIGGCTDIRIDTTACNGCGACITACPVNAIAMHQQ